MKNKFVIGAMILSVFGNVFAQEKVLGFENKKSSVSAALIGRYDSNAISADGGSMEIVTYNKKNNYAYVVSGIKGAIAAIKIEGFDKKNVTNLNGTEFDVKNLVSNAENLSGFVYGDITSISVSPDSKILAACIQHKDYSKNGAVAIFSFGKNGELVNPILYEVGIQPDMVTFANENTVLTANEGEPRLGYGENSVDPKGSVSVVDLKNKKVTNVGFEKFSSADLISKNIIVGKFDSKLIEPEFDLEPEYIAVSKDGKFAYVSLQEANAIAKLNIENCEFEYIDSCGFEDYSKVKVDIVKDKKYEAKTYENLIGARMPDGISIYESNGKTYILTANEGDAREWGEYCNEKKDKSLTEDAIRVIDKDCQEGLPQDKVVLFGGRSFTIFEATQSGLKEVFDSKDDFEKLTASYLPKYFNCSNDDVKIDSRSQKKGPEAETVTIGKIGKKVYAFIALERIGGIMIYEITNPEKSEYVNYINSRDFSEEIKGDVSPEGLYFAEKNGRQNPMLFAACEVSGTVAVYELK